MPALGFDIGSENSYIAAVKSGGIEILDNDYCLRATPTYVAFTENGREIGVSARNKVVTNLENTVFGLKRILGKKLEDLDFAQEKAHIPHEICKLPSGDIGIKVSYLKNVVMFSIEQLMGMMLTKLKILSEAKLGSRIRDCVIAVPAYYTDTQRRAMLSAASISGLNAMKLINESAAVALAYGFFKQNLSEESLKVVFVDFGSASLTVTACAFTKDKVRTLGCVWEDVGGRDFDNRLVQYFVDDFKVRYQLDTMTNRKALVSLIHECEQLKKLMSTNSLEIKFQIECFMQDKDVSGQIKREIFEKLSLDLFKKIERVFRRILQEAQLDCEHIHAVEIVGGSCRIPAVKQLIREIFGREPNATLNQDEAVARGCALQCALLSPLLKTRNFVVEDIPSYIIRIIWKNVDNRNEELGVFSYSDKIPSAKLITISMKKPLSLEVRYVDYYRGSFQKIGTYTFGNIPEEAECDESMKIRLKASLNAHGIFSLVSAKMIGKGVEENSNKSAYGLLSLVSANVFGKGVEEHSNKTDEEKIEDVSMNENEEKISDQVEQKEKSSSCLVKLYDLTINSDLPGLSEMQLNEYISAEQRMICADIEEKEKANARNSLEEYVYEARGKLSYELHDYVVEEDRTRLLFYLNETENWLYENEEEAGSEYSRRLKEVKRRIEPVFKRYAAWERKTCVVDEYQRLLQQAFECVCQLASTEESADTVTDIENLRRMWQNSKQYLDENVESFSKLKKCDDVTGIIEDLKKSSMYFQDDFQKSYSHLQKKIHSIKENEKVQSQQSGDGSSQDSEGSNQENNPKKPKENLLPDNVKEENV